MSSDRKDARWQLAYGWVEGELKLEWDELPYETRDQLLQLADTALTSRTDEQIAELAQIWRSNPDHPVPSAAEQRDAALAKLDKVRRYADDRAFHARGHLNTVNTGRIASDLYKILSGEN